MNIETRLAEIENKLAAGNQDYQILVIVYQSAGVVSRRILISRGNPDRELTEEEYVKLENSEEGAIA